MTHEEFLQRVKDNLKVDANYYTNWVEPLYMFCDQDKDQFCQSFNKWGKYMVDEKEETCFESWATALKGLEKSLHIMSEEQKRLKNEIANLQNIMIANGLEEVTGLQTRNLILRKIELGRELTKEQLDYIHNNL